MHFFLIDVCFFVNVEKVHTVVNDEFLPSMSTLKCTFRQRREYAQS
jgi:hypothetical protein